MIFTDPSLFSRRLSILLALVGLAAAQWVLPVTANTAEAPSPARELLARSIRYHDPAGVWDQKPFALDLGSTRPDFPDRFERVTIATASQQFSIVGGRTTQVERYLAGDHCRFKVEGSTTFSEEQAKELRLNCDRLKTMRNYHTYLWGLPMKLRDPGTRIDPQVKATSFDHREALEIRVSYEEGVGKDLWYFYFDPTSAALIGYRFYHDEAANDGEYITLVGETELWSAGKLLLRLPKERTWYTHQEDKLLGTDFLSGMRVLAE